jgi:hypothetical protein
VTIAAKHRLADARVLARSFAEHHPDIPFFVVLADEPGGLDLAAEPFETIPLGALGIPELRALCFRYDERQVSFAATPFAIRHVLDRGFGRVLFFKQEGLVLGSHAPVLDALERDALVLTPHLLEPATARAELQILLSGVYNGGLVGVSGRPAGRAFLDWWADRQLQHCRHDVAGGMHYEQRWLDLAPSLFEGVRILRDPAFNVGHWNLAERRIEVRDGEVLARGRPCALFRFSGYDPAAPEVVTRYFPDRTLADIGDAGRVFERYRSALEAAGWPVTAALPYAYGAFADGVPIPPAARDAYARLGERAATFGDPFATGEWTFRAWLETPVAGSGVPRLWHAIAESRIDLREAFPDHLGADRECYLRWAAEHGAREHAIPPALQVAA